REGHDAEGAELIAALDDRDVGLKGGAPRDLPELVDRVLLGELEREGMAPLAPRGVDQLADPLDLPGPGDEIDPRGSLEDLLPPAVRDAAGDPHDELRMLALALRQDAELGVELVLGLLADRARVEQDHARRGALLGAAESPRLELAGHSLAVQHIH